MKPIRVTVTPTNHPPVTTFIDARGNIVINKPVSNESVMVSVGDSEREMRTLDDLILNGGTEEELSVAWEQQMSSDVSRWMNVYLKWYMTHGLSVGHPLPLALRIGQILDTMPTMQYQSVDSVVKLAEAYKDV